MESPSAAVRPSGQRLEHVLTGVAAIHILEQFDAREALRMRALCGRMCTAVERDYVETVAVPKVCAAIGRVSRSAAASGGRGHSNRGGVALELGNSSPAVPRRLFDDAAVRFVAPSWTLVREHVAHLMALDRVVGALCAAIAAPTAPGDDGDDGDTSAMVAEEDGPTIVPLPEACAAGINPWHLMLDACGIDVAKDSSSRSTITAIGWPLCMPHTGALLRRALDVAANAGTAAVADLWVPPARGIHSVAEQIHLALDAGLVTAWAEDAIRWRVPLKASMCSAFQQRGGAGGGSAANRIAAADEAVTFTRDMLFVAALPQRRDAGGEKRPARFSATAVVMPLSREVTDAEPSPLHAQWGFPRFVDGRGSIVLENTRVPQSPPSAADGTGSACIVAQCAMSVDGCIAAAIDDPPARSAAKSDGANPVGSGSSVPRMRWLQPSFFEADSRTYAQEMERNVGVLQRALAGPKWAAAIDGGAVGWSLRPGVPTATSTAAASAVVVPAFLAAVLVGRVNLSWGVPHQNDRRRRIVTQGRVTHLEMPGTVASTDPAAAARFGDRKSPLHDVSLSLLVAGALPTLRTITIVDAADTAAPDLPSPLRSPLVPLDLRNTDTLTSLRSFVAAVRGCPLRIGPHALANLPLLTSVDLSGCTVATVIGDDFCARSPRLETIRLPPNVTSLGSNFLLDSFALQHLSLSTLTGLSAIGQNFCAGGRALRNITWPRAGKALRMRDGASTGDDETAPPPPPPPSVGPAMLLGVHCAPEWVVPDPCAAECGDPAAVTGVVSPIEVLRMQVIPKSFAQSCSGLVRCDLLGATWVKTIGPEAFSRCVDLRHIIFPSSVASVGRFVCTVCRELEIVDLSAAAGLEHFETEADCFATSCPKLWRIALPGHLRGLPVDIARFCEALTEVSMATAAAGTSVSADAMAAMVRDSRGAFEASPFRARLLFPSPPLQAHQ